MLNRTLSILLAATIAACPLLCKLGKAASRADGAASHSCCCCCHVESEPESSDEHSRPFEHGPKPAPRKCCQCICGGAIFEVVSLDESGIDLSVWMAVPLVEPLLAHAFEGQRLILTATLQPDDGKNAGRLLRCLYASLLC